MSFPGSSAAKESACNVGNHSPPHSRFNSWVRKIHWRRDRLPTPVFLGLPVGSASKETTCNVGDLGSIPEVGRSPGEGNGYLGQYSVLENSTDCVVRGVAKSWTRLSDFQWRTVNQMRMLNLNQIVQYAHRSCKLIYT